MALSTDSSAYTGSDILETLIEAKNYNQTLVNLVRKFFKIGTALDFGAGIGTFAEMIRDRNRSVVCVELDDSQRNFLKNKNFETYKNLSSSVANYDFIYSLNVLEHIENDQSVATELVNKLNENGIILVFVPAFQVLFSNFDKKIGHFRRYKKNQVRELFPDLQVIECRYFDSIGFLAALIFKIIANPKDGSVSKFAVKFFDKFLFPLNRIFDPLLSKWIGKNVLFVARKI